MEFLFSKNKILRIGTDCSGIEAPIQALKKLQKIYKFDYEHIFSSEIDKYARESLLANYKRPKYLFEDMTKKRTLEPIDIYVCGFPCQPFSYAGSRLGQNDKRCIFNYCIKTIKETNPKIFILENVKGIMTIDDGNYIKKIKSDLNKLKDYEVNISVYNTKDYGIPQNRERVFIVGLLKSFMIKKYEIPDKKPTKDINTYVENVRRTKDDKVVYDLSSYKGPFIDISFLKYISKDSYQTYSPTVISSGNLWSTKYGRKATVRELLALQGFPITFKQVVSDHQLKKQIGNSMSVNVLYYILKECFNCVDLKS